MNLVPIEAATTDMVLADDLRQTSKLPLLAAGTQLSEAMLASLRERGVTTLSVCPGELAEAPDGKARRQAVLERLSFLFRRNAADITSQALFRALYEYRTEAP